MGQIRSSTSNVSIARAVAPDIVGRTLLGLVIVCVYPRLFFGLAFFDEAYYLALPYSFSLGHRPLLDENAIHQLAGLLLQPFVGSYLTVLGSNEGLVLFGRHLYFLAALLTVWLVRGYWIRIADERMANLLAAIIIAFVPFCIFGLSYNTLMYLGLLSGSALLASACLPINRSRYLFCATLCLAVVGFAYPPAIFAAAIAIASSLFFALRSCSREERRAALAWTAAAGLGSMALALGYLVALGLPESLESLREFNGAQGLYGGGGSKWRGIQREFWFQSDFLVRLGAALLVILVGVAKIKNRRAAACLAALLWPTLAYASNYFRVYHAPFTTVPFVLSLLAIAAPFQLFVTRKRLPREQWIGLVIITLFSFLATLTILWSTSNGLRNAALGLTPAALVALGCLASIRQTAPEPDADADPRLPITILITSLLLFQLHQLWTHAYREFPPFQLEATVEHGAWRGIRTTPRKIAFMNELRSDLDRVRRDAESIIFFDYFPAGYLMSDLQPRTPGLWLFPDSRVFLGNAGLREVYADQLRGRRDLPDLVARMHCIPARPLTQLTRPEQDPLDALFSDADYETVVRRTCYSLAIRRPRDSGRER